MSYSALDVALAGLAQRDDLPPLLIRCDELAAFENCLGAALLQKIRKAGMDEKVLFVIRQLHLDEVRRTTDKEAARKSRRTTRNKLLKFGKLLNAMPKIVDFLLSVEFPYSPYDGLVSLRGRPLLGNEVDVLNGFQFPALEEATAALEVLHSRLQQFSEAEWREMAPETAAAWKRVGAMDSAEYYSHFVHERAKATRAFWLSPFCLSDQSVEALSGQPRGREARLQAFAAVSNVLARQMRDTARRLAAQGSPTGRGRKRETAQWSLIGMFAEYARRTTGRAHDAIGAELFSLTFGAIRVDTYARLRRIAAGRKK